MAERVSVIVNPTAGRGRATRLIPEITARFADVGVGDIVFTEKKGDENELARRAIAAGSTTLVVVGGDGTTTHVANTILQTNAAVRLAILPAGTGNDFAKVLGTDKADIATVARRSVESGDERVDVGKVEGRYFLNCCGFGFDVAVLEEIAEAKWLRGNAVYLYTALRQLLGYRGAELGIGNAERELYMLVVVANTEYFGGMFRIAPGALVADGELDVVAVRNVLGARRVALLTAAMKGDHRRFPECVMERAGSIQLSFPEPPAYETDGELHRAQSAHLTVTSCPAALRVVTAPGVVLR
jgi:diacylglycerol kinase (ATP)